MKNFSTVILILIIFSSSKCNKDDTLINFTLPEKTETGANTFGFLLNSNVWTNFGQVCFITGGCHENLNTIFRNNYFNIYADRVLRKNGGLSTSESIVISLDSRQPITTGNYILGYNNNNNFYYRITSPSSSEKEYFPSDSLSSFTLKINKLDTVNKVISGQFQGTLYQYAFQPSNPASSGMRIIDVTDSLKITDGRFDVKYQ